MNGENVLESIESVGAEAGERSAPNQDNLRILIIEDNLDAAESLEMLLGLSGHEIDVAYDGQTGIECALAKHPHVIFCDLGLPGEIDGFIVAKTLRANSAFAPTMLVALSGYGQEEDRRRTREAGFDRHLVKPADEVALFGALTAARERLR